jgi:hypothetical protein
MSSVLTALDELLDSSDFTAAIIGDSFCVDLLVTKFNTPISN